MYLPYNPEITFLNIYTKEMKQYADQNIVKEVYTNLIKNHLELGE